VPRPEEEAQHAAGEEGRFRGFLEAVLVRVILNDRAALMGAARHAAALLA